MASTFWVLTLVLGSLFLFASGQNSLCSDPNDENCVLKLKTLNISNSRRRVPYRQTYRINEVLDLSNHALNRLLLIRNYRPTNDYSIRMSVLDLEYTTHWPATPDTRDEEPYIDLYGVTELNLSNNSVPVGVLVNILYKQRHGRTHPLKYLDMSYMNITWLPDYIFKLLPYIEVLKLNNNPIGNMDFLKIAIQLLNNLKELDISGCALKSLPFDLFEGVPLTKLNLNNNYFSTVPRILSFSSTLLQLSIDNNPITLLDDTSFRALYMIEDISAENCGIHTITGETFSNNFKLKKLNLKNNEIRHLLPNDINMDLTTVSLENNPWDCTCRNLWLMRETRRTDTILDKPHNIRCGTPALYANRTLYEAAATVETSNDCDLLFLNLFRLPADSDSVGSFMTKNAIINIFIVTGLLAIVAIVATLVLIKKFNNDSKRESYKPLHKNLLNKNSGLLSEENFRHNVILDVS